jgi:hypothetical protein
MLAQSNRRGAAAGIVVAVIFLLLIAGGIWYFVSKPFQTHVNQAITQATDWTPENIKKDPEGYLTWAIKQVDGTRDKLQAAQLALTKQKIEVSNKLEEKSTQKSQCEALLTELKKAYTTATDKNQWPVTVGQSKFDDERELKRKIVEASHFLDNASQLVDTYSKAKGKVSDRLDDIDGQMTKVEELKTKLATDLETAKVKQTFEGIEGVHDDFTNILNTSKALTETEEHNTSISDMIKPSGDAKVDEEFDKIMGKNKPASDKK